MKKVLLFFVLIFSQSAFCDYTFSTTEYLPTYPQYQRHNRNTYNFNNRNFDRTERRLLRQNYRNETQRQRLNRMEEAMFGSVQSGDIASRYNNVKRAMSYKNPYNNVYTQKKRFWNNFFNGVPTGFTPPVNDDYYDNGYTYQNTYQDNWGNYGNNAYNFQNGMRIKILD